MTCPLGKIVDLSAGGMRVRTVGKPPVVPGQLSRFSITCAGRGLSVQGCVAWCRRKSWRSREYEFGVKFQDMRPGLRELLGELAEYGFFPDADEAHTRGRKPADPSGRPKPAAGGASEASPPPRAALEIEDLYAILGVARDADGDAIRVAYRALARTLHPDVNKAPDAHARFALVSKAYSVLRHEKSRAKYDEMLAKATPAPPAPDAARAPSADAA